MLRCGCKTQQLFADELIEGHLRSVTVSDRASGFALPIQISCGTLPSDYPIIGVHRRFRLLPDVS
jgi:hypothetical protein